MAVYKDKKRGTWYVDIRYRDSTGKVRGIVRRGFATEIIAQREERRILREHTAEDKPASQRSMIEIGLEMFDEIKYDMLPETHDQRIQQVKDYIPNDAIGKITANKTVRWRNNLSEIQMQNGKYLSVTFKNRMIHLYKRIIKYALANDYIHKDPTLRMHLYKKTSKDYIDYNVPDPDTFFAAYNVLKERTPNNIWFKMFILIAYSSGLSRAEIKGLKGKDFTNSSLSVYETISGKDKRDRNKVGPTKRRSRRRVVTLDSSTTQELTRLRDILVEWDLYSEDKLLIGFESSLPNNTIQNNFKKMELGCRLHDLRHAHTTMLIQNNVPINEVAKRMGHSNVTTTLNVYTHVMQSDDDNSVDVLNDLFKNKINP